MHALALDQAADRNQHLRAVRQAEAGARGGAVDRMETLGVDAVADDFGSCQGRAQFDRQPAQRIGDREHPGGGLQGARQPRAQRRIAAVRHFGAAQGDRHRQAQPAPQPGGGFAVGIGEVRVDQARALGASGAASAESCPAPSTSRRAGAAGRAPTGSAGDRRGCPAGFPAPAPAGDSRDAAGGSATDRETRAAARRRRAADAARRETCARG